MFIIQKMFGKVRFVGSEFVLSCVFFVAYVERSAGLANVLSITVRAFEFVNATFVIYVFICFGLAM